MSGMLIEFCITYMVIEYMFKWKSFQAGGTMLKQLSVLLASALVFLPLSASAEITVSYIKSTPAKDDPGNEIKQQDIELDAITEVHSSSDGQYNLETGVSLLSTSWEFDAPVLDNVDLLKVKVPFKSTKVISDRTILVGNLTPGLHGESDDMSSADFRVEGSLMTILPRGKHQWIFGLGFGDQFGEPQLFPIIGSVWSATDKLTLQLVMPSLGATYAYSDNLNYTASIAPAGGQWSFEAGTAGNADDVDLQLTGTRTGLGGEWQFVKDYWLTFKAGIESGREVAVSRHDDPSINASLDLEDSWFVQLGFKIL